jgi:hypothetical protein
MIGVYSFDFNRPFMQVFYFSFLIAEATSLLFFLWWVARRIVMATVIRSLGITGISGYPLSVEMAIIAGLQTTTIVGLGDSAIKVAKDRLLSEKH